MTDDSSSLDGATSTTGMAAQTAESPASDKHFRDRLMDSFYHYERDFRSQRPLLWWGTLVGPWLMTLAVIGVVSMATNAKFMASLLGLAATAFLAAGRFIILAGKNGGFWQSSFVSDVQLFWLVTYEDVVVALFLAFHIGFMFRIPYIGPKIAELTADGQFILASQPWMKRFTFWGLVAFIAFPLAATGSVGGAIFGRLLGLTRSATFWGSTIGAVLGNAAMLCLADVMKAVFPEDSLLVRFGGLGVIALLVVLMERRYSQMKRRFLANETPAAESSQAA